MSERNFTCYFNDGNQRYKHFRDERYLKKFKKLCDTITKVNLQEFDVKDKKQESLKHTVKKLWDSQKHIDIARASGILTKEMFCFDHLINNNFFEEDLTVKAGKSDLVKELDKCLTFSD